MAVCFVIFWIRVFIKLFITILFAVTPKSWLEFWGDLLAEAIVQKLTHTPVQVLLHPAKTMAFIWVDLQQKTKENTKKKEIIVKKQLLYDGKNYIYQHILKGGFLT